MAAILLTPNNLNFVKNILRRLFPQVKSAHLTEALASGANYRTHASLLAAAKSAPAGRPILTCIEYAAMTARLSEFGYSGYDLAGINAIIRSPELPDRIWVKFRSGDLRSNNYWYRECQIRDIPNVQIERRTKFVKLKWDCVSIESRSEAHVQGERGAALVRKMFESYQSIASRTPGKSVFFGSSFVGSVDRLLPEHAHELADKLFAMLYEPMCTQKFAA